MWVHREYLFGQKECLILESSYQIHSCVADWNERLTFKGPIFKRQRGVDEGLRAHPPTAGNWGVIPALGVLWTLSSHCLTCRREKSSKQIKASSESFKWPKKSRSRMSALCFYLWNTKFKQSSPFRIHLAIKIAFQVIICKEVGSI